MSDTLYSSLHNTAATSTHTHSKSSNPEALRSTPSVHAVSSSNDLSTLPSAGPVRSVDPGSVHPGSVHPGIIVALALPLPLLLPPLALLTFSIVYRKYRKRNTSRQLSKDALLPHTPMIISPLPSPTVTPTGYIQYPLPVENAVVTNNKVWVLYSLDTPEEQQKTIHELLFAGLLEFGLEVKTPGNIPSRDVHREWIETGVTEAGAVLFVCNDQFYSEWLSDDVIGVGGIRIGRDARMIKNGAKCGDLDKFAFVHFEESDLKFCGQYPEILTPFITRYFSLCGDKCAALYSIAGFVMNIPKFQLDSSGAAELTS